MNTTAQPGTAQDGAVVVEGIVVEGIGFWASGLPGLDALRGFLRSGRLVEACASRPAPQLLAANERRRVPDTVAAALEVAQAACSAAGRDPSMLPSVFTSTHGDLAITDYMCETLTTQPRAISPTRFHNSVHNAAAGYWTIGTGCREPATALSAYDASFAQGLVEAAAMLHSERRPLLLVAYDAGSPGPFAAISPSIGLLAAALVLAPAAAHDSGPRLRIALEAGSAGAADSALNALLGGNAMAPMLPLLELLAAGRSGSVGLHAGPGSVLRVEVEA